MTVLLLFVMIVGFLLMGVPIAVSLGLSSMLFLLLFSDTSLASIAQSFFQAMAGHYTLLAIPFFILASSFMSTGGVATRIIRFSIATVGHFRGGLQPLRRLTRLYSLARACMFGLRAAIAARVFYAEEGLW